LFLFFLLFVLLVALLSSIFLECKLLAVIITFRCEIAIANKQDDDCYQRDVQG
jgi:hypothetical protein